MIVPGKDNNYPGSSGQGAAFAFMPHTIVGLLLALIIILLAYHLLKGSVRVRR